MKGKKSAKSDGARSAVWRNRIVGHGEVNPLEIVAHPKNYKSHPDHQAGALKAAIEDVGFVRSVTVNKRTGTLIDGHLRVGMAIKAKQSKIAVEYVDLSEAEEKRVLATLDPIGALAEVDDEALDQLLADVGLKASEPIDVQAPAPKKVNFELKPKFEIVVECRSEADQKKTLRRLMREGLTCRAIVF